MTKILIRCNSLYCYSTYEASTILIILQVSIKFGLTEILLLLVARNRSGSEFCIALDLDCEMDGSVSAISLTVNRNLAAYLLLEWQLR